MSRKHTPGPWSAEPDALGGDTAVVEALTKDRRYVKREICHVLLDDSDAKSRATDRANLLLIAAAPDLFAACEALIAQQDAGMDLATEVDRELEAMRAAIAKARGGAR